MFGKWFYEIGDAKTKMFICGVGGFFTKEQAKEAAKDRIKTLFGRNVTCKVFKVN